MIRTLTTRFCAAAAVVLGVVALFASAASAHSELVSVSPSPSSTVAQSPSDVELGFNERVEINAKSIRVYDNAGNRIATNPAKHSATDSRIIETNLPRLVNGSYIVAWSVVSADSHPVQGAFTFSVGEATQTNGASTTQITKLLDSSSSPQSVRNIFTVARTLVFGTLLFLIGLFGFEVFRIAAVHDDKRLRQAADAAIFLCILATLLTIVTQAAVSNGYSLGQALHWQAIKNELGTRYGKFSLVRISVLVVLTGIILRLRQFKYLRAIYVVSAIVLTVTLVFNGHGANGWFPVLSGLLDGTHVLTASLWFGGLLILPYVIRSQHSDASNIANRFSRLALVCVVLIFATGTYAWWRQVGGYQASLHTWFGRLITIKFGLFLFAICIASISRSHTNRAVADGQLATKKLIRAVRLESLILMGVLICTAIVVSSVPGRQALSSPNTIEIKMKTTIVDATVTSTKVGPVNLHFYVLGTDGTPKSVPDLSATWTNKAKKVGPLPINVSPGGENHFLSYGSQVPFPGTWQLSVHVRIDDFTEETGSANVRFR